MPDQSHLDNRYFVSAKTYNCPFCNRRHVSYSVYAHIKFEWTDGKPCYGYFVQCHSCGGHSMHLTFTLLELVFSGKIGSTNHSRFSFESGVDSGSVLEQTFFYSVPTSSLILDERAPRILRSLLTEAEGCLKSNYLTGASACARKIIYGLGVLSKSKGDSYEERIKSLKQIHLEVEPTFFDTLLTIQQVTSSKVHENSYDGWGAKHLRIILAALAEVLHEIYVLPALREDRRKAVLALKDELVPPIKK